MVVLYSNPLGAQAAKARPVMVLSKEEKAQKRMEYVARREARMEKKRALQAELYGVSASVNKGKGRGKGGKNASVEEIERKGAADYVPQTDMERRIMAAVHQLKEEQERDDATHRSQQTMSETASKCGSDKQEEEWRLQNKSYFAIDAGAGGSSLPLPHFGIEFAVEEGAGFCGKLRDFDALAVRARASKFEFTVPPRQRCIKKVETTRDPHNYKKFIRQTVPVEMKTMFLKDECGNHLMFRAPCEKAVDGKMVAKAAGAGVKNAVIPVAGQAVSETVDGSLDPLAGLFKQEEIKLIQSHFLSLMQANVA